MLRCRVLCALLFPATHSTHSTHTQHTAHMMIRAKPVPMLSAAVRPATLTGCTWNRLPSPLPLPPRPRLSHSVCLVLSLSALHTHAMRSCDRHAIDVRETPRPIHRPHRITSNSARCDKLYVHYKYIFQPAIGAADFFFLVCVCLLEANVSRINEYLFVGQYIGYNSILTHALSEREAKRSDRKGRSATQCYQHLHSCVRVRVR